MVNFRFHIVSLVAVFLALALGIGMGVTVIDKATVDLLQRRLDNVRDQANAADQRSDLLDRQLARAGEYDTHVEEYLTDHQLTGVPVVIVGIKGIEQGPLSELKKTLDGSGAATQGILWFADKVRLTDASDVTTLSRDLEQSTNDATQLRQGLLARVNTVLAGASDPNALSRLIDDGFLEWEGGKGSNEITKVSFGNARLVVTSGANAVVANDQLAIPLLKLLAAQPAKRVVAIESGREPDQHNSGIRAVFLGPVRSDQSFNGKLSTVDNIEVSPGRVATVLALAELANGRTGDYGFGGSTDGPIPKLAS